MAPASNHIRRTYAVRDTNVVPNTNAAMLFLVQPIHQFHSVNLINSQGSQPLHINGSATVQHAPPRPRAKRFALTFDIVAQKFHIPIAKAAKEFGMSTATLQLRCRELGFEKWPFPKLKCLTNLGKNVMEFRFTGFQNVLEGIKDEIESIKQNPSLDIKDETKVLRQRMYELKKMKRRNIDSSAS